MRSALRIAYYGLERRVPASLLLITADIALANTVYGALERTLGARVWVWHERELASALKVLAVCRFRLLLLDVGLRARHPGMMLRALKQAAPETPVTLLAAHPSAAFAVERRRLGDAARERLGGAVALVPRDDSERLLQVVRQVLKMPATHPSSDRGPPPRPGSAEEGVQP